MVSFPPCKINIGLHVLSKRADGYHDIETCFYPVPWTDILDIVPAKDFSFAVSGARIPGPSADNLCRKAYTLLQKTFNLKPVAMHLHKCLPTGAGLGGGSSDGAYTLRSLNQLFDLGLSADRLREFASALGSDCAFFVGDRPQIGTGRGEVLSDVSVSLQGKFLIIVKPEADISTAAAYAGVVPRERDRTLREVIENHPLREWRQLLQNDFEPHIFKSFPVVEALHQKLYAHGAAYAQMSGSGSAVFGIFEHETHLEKAFESFTYWSGYLS